MVFQTRELLHVEHIAAQVECQIVGGDILRFFGGTEHLEGAGQDENTVAGVIGQRRATLQCIDTEFFKSFGKDDLLKLGALPERRITDFGDGGRNADLLNGGFIEAVGLLKLYHYKI